MNELEISKAIQYLKPNAEFSFAGTDYDSVDWHVLEGDAPTWEDIQVANKTIKELEAKAQKELLAKKAAAEAKLTALGLTIDDLKALGLA